jgi:predicted MFS family arabinose efflux permease
MGLCITPLTATVMGIAQRRPELAGSAAGVLSTVQQVGNAVGVAGIGLVFFATAGDGYGRAFALASLVLAVLLVVVAGGARRLPARRRSV